MNPNVSIVFKDLYQLILKKSSTKVLSGNRTSLFVIVDLYLIVHVLFITVLWLNPILNKKIGYNVQLICHRMVGS